MKFVQKIKLYPVFFLINAFQFSEKYIFSFFENKDLKLFLQI